MPIAPVAKGLIIVSGILITASIALYENEHVREFVDSTGRKMSEVWDDIVNFDQRQRQRRAHAYGFGAGGEVQEMGNRGNPFGQRRRDITRRTQDAAGQGTASGVEGRKGMGVDDDIPAAVLQESIEAEGLRKRKARAMESQEHLLGETQSLQPAVIDQAEDPAISVPELDTAAVPAANLSNTSEIRSLESSSSFSTAESRNMLEEPAAALLDHQMAALVGQDRSHSLIDQQVEQITTTHAPLTAINLSNNNQFNGPTESAPVVDQQDNNPFSDQHQGTATPNLTLTIPDNETLNNRSRTQSTATISPVLVHTPTSMTASSVSGGMHTPPQQEEEFDAMSDTGTETASQVSEWRQDRDDDMQSVASEESGASGWSEIGSEG